MGNAGRAMGVVIGAAMCAGAAGSATSLRPVVADGCAASAAAATEPDMPPIIETAENTVVFNHYALAPMGRRLRVSVREGEYFRIRFVCTDPRKFNYTITAAGDTPQKAAARGVRAESVETDDLSRQTSVTMRHSTLFTRYRVEVSLRDDLKGTAAGATHGGSRPASGAAPEPPYRLYSALFDVWVETPARRDH